MNRRTVLVGLNSRSRQGYFSSRQAALMACSSRWVATSFRMPPKMLQRFTLELRTLLSFSLDFLASSVGLVCDPRVNRFKQALMQSHWRVLPRWHDPSSWYVPTTCTKENPPLCSTRRNRFPTWDLRPYVNAIRDGLVSPPERSWHRLRSEGGGEAFEKIAGIVLQSAEPVAMIAAWLLPLMPVPLFGIARF